MGGKRTRTIGTTARRHKRPAATATLVRLAMIRTAANCTSGLTEVAIAMCSQDGEVRLGFREAPAGDVDDAALGKVPADAIGECARDLRSSCSRVATKIMHQLHGE